MAQVEMPSIFGQFLAGKKVGEEDRRKRTLSEFLQPALGGDQAALAKVYGVDPDAGLRVQGLAQKQAAGDREQSVADLQQAARLYASAPPEMKGHLYGRIVDLTEKVGLAAPGSLPRQHDPALDANFNQFLAGIAGPANDYSDRYKVVGDALLDLSNPTTPVYSAPQKPRFHLSPDGAHWLQEPMAAPQQAPNGAPAAAGPMMGQAFYDEVGKLISPYGANVGSTSGGEHNVGSPHYDGRALDIPLGASATDAVRANADRIIADLSGKGYTVRDERTRPDGQKVWSGPHLHVEPPAQPRASSSGGAIPIPGATPRSKASFTMLSPQEAAQYGLTPGTVAQRNEETGQVSVVSKPDARAGTGVMPLSAGEATKVRRDFKETKDALNTFKAFDQALGDIPEGMNLVFDGAAKGRLGTSYNNARAALRILYNTGVLQPGELPMLESALRDPTSFTAIMDPRTRPQIQSQLDELYRTVTRGIENQVASYPQIFNQQKFDDFRQQKGGAAQSGPAAGTVEAGYRFKGGDPANPSNWEKV